jgi:hypothetical protein
MALTQSKPASIFTPEGNSLAVFIDVNDGELKLKDVFGGVQLFSDLAGGGGLKLKDDALMTATLTEVVDKDNTPSVLRISTIDVTNYGGGNINTNTAFGKNSLVANTTGSGNVALGLQALPSNTIGASNVGIGFSALLANTEGASNIGVGTNALNANATGNFNTVVGTQSAIGITTGSNNVVFGTFAIPTLNGSNNTILGYNTGQGITTGSNNTILGANVAGLSSTLNNNVIIADGSGNQRVVIDGSGNVGLNNGTSTTQATSVIRSLGTNSGIAIVPNGSSGTFGALTTSVPNGLASGGNARGLYAIDLQIYRFSAARVASGVGSFIGGGRDNSATNQFSTVVAGSNNVNSGIYGTIGGGVNNTLGSGQSTISGGESNTASTGTHAAVVGGQSNVSSGAHSVSGGNTNTASGGSSIALGQSNIVSGSNGSFAAGQQNNVSGAFNAALCAANTVSGSRNFAAGGSNTVSGNDNGCIGSLNAVSGTLASFAVGSANQSSNYGFVSGFKGVTIGYASRVLSNSAFGTLASSQIREMIASREAVLLSGANAQLSLDGTGITNLISLLYDVNRMFHVTLKYVAVVTNITGTATGVNIGDIKTQTIELGVKRIITTSSIVGAGNFSTPQEDTSMSTSSLIPSIVANDLILTFNAPTFGGGGSLTIRVVSKVELVEVAYA